MYSRYIIYIYCRYSSSLNIYIYNHEQYTIVSTKILRLHYVYWNSNIILLYMITLNVEEFSENSLKNIRIINFLFTEGF